MSPLTLRHKQGKVILSDESITVERAGFPRPAPQQIPLSQIAAVHHTVTVPSAFGKGGAMSITLRLINAPAVDLELVGPLSAAQQLVSAVETSIAERPVAQSDTAVPVAVAPAPQEQMVKVYRGGDCAKQFEKDAKKLAAKGWRVQSQSYGGQTNKAGAVIMFGVLGLAAGTKPREMTVIYVRD